jgi:hypothetical protein
MPRTRNLLQPDVKRKGSEMKRLAIEKQLFWLDDARNDCRKPMIASEGRAL